MKGSRSERQQGKVRQERVEALLLASKVEEGGHASRNVGDSRKRPACH